MGNIQKALNSRFAIGLGLGLSRAVPTRTGYAIANWAADRISARRNSLIVRSVRANQWVVHNQPISSSAVDELARQAFRSTARSLFEFWHFFRDPQAVMDMVIFDPSFTACAQRALNERTGTILVAPHISNFDMIIRAVVLRGLPLHVLSYPQPPGGYRRQNNLRELPGLQLTPISIQSLRLASQTLRDGGVVTTGVDRPLAVGDEAKYPVTFFGRKAALPVFHIRLAVKHDLPITVLGACRTPDGRYRLWASDPIAMSRSSDLVEETTRNAEAVLRVMEEDIRRAPDQWAMFYPVWPETLDLVPSARGGTAAPRAT